MKWTYEEFRREGLVFDGIYRYPSGSKSDPVEPTDRAKFKPGAGMLRRAARDLHLCLSESVTVGSRSIDVAAANAGELNNAFLLRGSDGLTSGGANTAVDSLGEVEAWLVVHGKGANLPPASHGHAVA
jgi:D-glycero-D-manno-heptose 1,7-bisphosphate phosphatase